MSSVTKCIITAYINGALSRQNPKLDRDTKLDISTLLFLFLLGNQSCLILNIKTTSNITAEIRIRHVINN